MSYSFQVTAATKDEAKAAVAAELDKVVTNQPAHAKDRDAALATAGAFVDLLPDNAAKDIAVSVNDWVSWDYSPDDATGANSPLNGASVTVGASLVPKRDAETV